MWQWFVINMCGLGSSLKIWLKLGTHESEKYTYVHTHIVDLFVLFAFSAPSKHCSDAWGFFRLFNLHILKETLEIHCPQLKIKPLTHGLGSTIPVNVHKTLGSNHCTGPFWLGWRRRHRFQGQWRTKVLAHRAPWQLGEGQWLCPTGSRVFPGAVDFGVVSCCQAWFSGPSRDARS